MGGVDFSNVHRLALRVVQENQAVHYATPSSISRIAELTGSSVKLSPAQALELNLLIIAVSFVTDELILPLDFQEACRTAMATLDALTGPATDRPVTATAAAVAHGSSPAASTVPRVGTDELVPLPAAGPDFGTPPPGTGWRDQIFVVIGAGPMGRGIAYNYLLQFPGVKVRLCEYSSKILTEAQTEIEGIIEDGIKRGKLTEAEAATARANITYWDGQNSAEKNATVVHDAVQGAAVIQEAIVEKLGPKLDLFSILRDAAPAEALIFTNTSAYTVQELESVMGGRALTAHHYFNPAYKMKLVEKAHGKNPLSASQQALLQRYERQLGKVVLEAPDTAGFYVNRFFVPLLNIGITLFETLKENLDGSRRQAEEGAPVYDITDLDLMVLVDVTTRQILGTPQGPFELLDMTKPHITQHAATIMAQRLGGFYNPPATLNALIKDKQAAGLFGYPLQGRESVELESMARLREIYGESKLQTMQFIIRERTLGVLFRVMDNLIAERVAAGIPVEQAVRDVQIASMVGVGYRAGAIALANGAGIEKAKALAASVEGDGLKPVTFLEKVDLVDGKIPIALVNYSAVDGVARIRIENPGKRNVLNPEMVAQLTAAFDRAQADDAVKMIVFEGLGGDLAGADIGFFIRNLKRGVAGLNEIMQFVKNGLDLYSKMENSKKRVVAVLDGGTFGGGLELALAAHDIIVTPQAKLAFPETGLGIVPGLRGADRLTSRVGPGIAFWMMMTGDPKEHTLSGADFAVMDASISLVERSDLEATLARLAAGEEQPSPISGESPAKQRYGIISKLFSWSEGEQMQADLINGVAHPELTGAEKEIYDEALAIASKRPRAALQLAKQLMEVGDDAADYRAVRSVFLTPMALHGLSTMGREMKVVNRTQEEWHALLLGEHFIHIEVVSMEGPVLNLRFTGPIYGKVRAESMAIMLRNRVNARDGDGQVNDLAAIHLRYQEAIQDPEQEVVVMRTGPGEKFEVGDSHILRGGSGAAPAATPAAAPSAMPIPGAGARSASTLGIITHGGVKTIQAGRAVLAESAMFFASEPEPPVTAQRGRTSAGPLHCQTRGPFVPLGGIGGRSIVGRPAPRVFAGI